VWLGMINNPNGTVGWGLSRNEWKELDSRIFVSAIMSDIASRCCSIHMTIDLSTLYSVSC